MSVYILGISMPSCCAECRFLSEYGDYPVCIITDEQRGYNFRIRELKMPHCPLITVPPHGRLIDADAFEAKYGSAQFWGDRDAAKKVRHAPTIIPADKEGEG